MSTPSELQPAAGQPMPFLQFQPVASRSSFPYHAAVQYQPMNRRPSNVIQMDESTMAESLFQRHIAGLQLQAISTRVVNSPSSPAFFPNADRVAYVVTEELQRSSSPPSKRRRRIGSEESEQASVAAIVDNITAFCVAPLGDFERKALRGLVKRLRTCPNMVESLVFALNSKCAQTPCVVFPRTLDGRMQVGKQKCIPQETFVRIFRLPDCNRESLCKVKECTSDLNFFCVNPYHYEYNADAADAAAAQKLRRPPRRSVEAIDANNNLGIPFPPPEAGVMSQNESATRKGSGTLHAVISALMQTPTAVPPAPMVDPAFCKRLFRNPKKWQSPKRKMSTVHTPYMAQQLQAFQFQCMAQQQQQQAVQFPYIGNPYENPYEACQRKLNPNRKFPASPEPVQPKLDTIEDSVNYMNEGLCNWNEQLVTERAWKDYEAFVG